MKGLRESAVETFSGMQESAQQPKRTKARIDAVSRGILSQE
jgi:hypothetical protein